MNGLVRTVRLIKLEWEDKCLGLAYRDCKLYLMKYELDINIYDTGINRIEHF